MRTTLNRVLLALAGLVLLAVGLAVLVGSLDLPRHWDFTLPDWWPFTGPKDVLLTDRSRTRYRSDDWWWPVVFAVLGALVLGSLWWLLAQTRTRRVRQLRLDSGDGQGALLRGRSLERTLVAEADAYDGVAWAGARLVRRRGAPEARLILGLEPHAAPLEVVVGLDDTVLTTARASTGREDLSAEARLRVIRHRAARVT